MSDDSGSDVDFAPAPKKAKLSSMFEDEAAEDSGEDSDAGFAAKGGNKKKRNQISDDEDEDDNEEADLSEDEEALDRKILEEEGGFDDMFIDDDNEEEEESGSGSEGSGSPRKRKKKKKKSKKKKKKKKKKRRHSDLDEEDGSGSEMSKRSDLESDEEDDSVSEESGDSDYDRKKKRRKEVADEEEDEDLEDDEYALLEENLGYKIDRPKSKKSFKRLKKKQRDRAAVVATGADLEKELFDDDEDDDGFIVDDESASRKKDRRGGMSEDEEEDEIDYDEEEDGVDDFIVDEHGQSLRKKKKKQRRAGGGAASSEAMREAQEIFGEEFMQFYEEEDDYDDEEDEEDDDFIERAPGEERQAKKKKKKKAKKTVKDVYEPSVVERRHMGDRDEEIRITDQPERFQLRGIVRPKAADNVAEEAVWIFKHAFSSEAMQEDEEDDSQAANGYKAQNDDDADEWVSSPVRDENASSGSGSEKAGLHKDMIPRIQAAIEYFKAGYEVPFIAMYRKEYCYMVHESEEDLVIDDNGNGEGQNRRRMNQDIKNLKRLWKLFEWDEKWVKFIKRKELVKKLCGEVQKFQEEEQARKEALKVKYESGEGVVKDENQAPKEPNEEGDQPAEESKDDLVEITAKISGIEVESDVKTLTYDDILRVEDAGTEEELSDLELWFALHFAELIQIIRNRNNKSRKKPVKRTLYSVCRKAGLLPLVRKMGMLPEEFGTNLEQNYHRHAPENISESPEDCANVFVSRKFPSTDSVMRACRLTYAEELSKDPRIRGAARKYFFEKAMVSTFPTNSGRSFVDEHHEYYGFLYISSKPVNTFKGDLFLKLLQAEQEGFIVISIDYDFIDSKERGKAILKGDKVEVSEQSSVTDHFTQLFNLDMYGEMEQAWNEERSLVIRELISKHFLPHFEREIRTKLEEDCKQKVVSKCEDEIFAKINVKQFKIIENDMDDDEEQESCSPVMACKVGDKDSPTFFANLDGEGEVTDFLRLDSFLNRLTSKNYADVDKKQADMNALKHFLSRKQPAAIVIGAENVDAHRVVYDDVMTCVRDAIREENIPDVVVHMVNPEVARIFEISERAMGEFPEYPHALRHAVSLARQFQDPLCEYATLCNTDDEIMCLKLHRFQGKIEPNELKKAMDRAFMSAVCLTGIDATRVTEHKHCSSTVQFISGLGPRKAGALLQAVMHEGILTSRQDLVTRGFMGQLIFENCAGFIRVKDAGYTTDAYIDILDETRIHPENYDFARKMAADSLEYPQDEEGEYPEQAMTEIFEKPETVEDLGLDDYAAEIEKKQQLKKRNTLYDIKREFFNSFKDYRDEYKPMGQAELFYLVTGETEKTLHQGCVIECQVSGTSKNGAMTRLDNGLMGFIPRELISDSEVKYVEDRVKKGMMVHCRVERIDMNKYSIDLSTRSSDLNNAKISSSQVDDYFDRDRAEECQNMVLKATKPRKQGKAKRVIVHPSFKNVSFREAEKLLETSEVGECIIRPSSKSDDHLTVTWKVSEDLYQHVDVEEREKVNKFSIGQTLMIGDERYEDLDEIIARYIQPMASYVQEMKDHDKYRTGTKEEVDTLLKFQKTREPKRIPYFFSLSDQYVGKFLLSYIPGTSVRHEYVSVIPEGYRFRGYKFPGIDQLIGWFKRHYNEKPKERSHRNNKQHQPKAPSPNRGRDDYNYSSSRGYDDNRGGGGHRGGYDDNSYNRGDGGRGYGDGYNDNQYGRDGYDDRDSYGARGYSETPRTRYDERRGGGRGRSHYDDYDDNRRSGDRYGGSDGGQGRDGGQRGNDNWDSGRGDSYNNDHRGYGSRNNNDDRQYTDNWD
eukprot:Nk52_evm16s266 gene=Nk52_evmTU16s266